MRRREIDEAIGDAIVGMKPRRAHMQPFHLVFRDQRGGLAKQEIGEGIAGEELRCHRRAAIAEAARAGDILQRLFGLIGGAERSGAGTRHCRQSSGENRAAAHPMHQSSPHPSRRCAKDVPWKPASPRSSPRALCITQPTHRL